MVLRATPEKKEEKARTRMALLRAALRLGAEHGFASLGLREVAREGGIAPTSFYRHFTDMDELGRALIEELVGPLVVGLADQVRRADRRAIGSALVDAMFAAVKQDPALVRFMLAERVGSNPALRSALGDKLALLAAALHNYGGQGPTRKLPPFGGDAALALLLDGFARALDHDPSQRAALREQLLMPLRTLLEADAYGPRRA